MIYVRSTHEGVSAGATVKIPFVFLKGFSMHTMRVDEPTAVNFRLLGLTLYRAEARCYTSLLDINGPISLHFFKESGFPFDCLFYPHDQLEFTLINVAAHWANPSIMLMGHAWEGE